MVILLASYISPSSTDQNTSNIKSTIYPIKNNFDLVTYHVYWPSFYSRYQIINTLLTPISFYISSLLACNKILLDFKYLPEKLVCHIQQSNMSEKIKSMHMTIVHYYSQIIIIIHRKKAVTHMSHFWTLFQHFSPLSISFYH